MSEVADLLIRCPFCGEPAGSPCRTRSFKYHPHDLGYFHKQRTQVLLMSTTSPAEPQRSKFSSLGKYCVCSHGIGSHRDSAGATATYCRKCSCEKYERDYGSGRDWSERPPIKLDKERGE